MRYSFIVSIFFKHLEINDSCEFVEIPEFGNCILKIFLQIMSIIRFLLHKILEKQQQKEENEQNG